MSASRESAIVVPGHSAGGRLSERCRRVLLHAAELAQRCEPRVIVFSGWSPRGGRSEAVQMLEAWPGRRDVELVVETTAATTAQNASRTLPLLLAREIREATVVCTPLHAPRVRYFFEQLYESSGVQCDVAPVRVRPSPRAIAWEIAALAVKRRQLRSAFAELDPPRA